MPLPNLSIPESIRRASQSITTHAAATYKAVEHTATSVYRDLKEEYEQYRRQANIQHQQEKQTKALVVTRTELYLSEADRAKKTAEGSKGYHDPLAERDEDAAEDVVTLDPGLECEPESLTGSYVVVRKKATNETGALL